MLDRIVATGRLIMQNADGSQAALPRMGAARPAKLIWSSADGDKLIPLLQASVAGVSPGVPT